MTLSRRVAYLAAAVAVSAVIGIALLPVRPGFSQDAVPGSDLAALQRELADLRQRVQTLEERPATFKAPFIVTDGQDREILRVAIAGDTKQAKLVLGSESAARFEAGVADGGIGSFVTLIDQAGVERTSIAANANGTTIGLTSAQGFEIFKAGVEAEEIKLTLGTEPGARLEAGVEKGGDGSFLKLTDKANTEQVAATATDTPRLVVGAEEGARLQAGVLEGQTGAFMSLIDKANAEGAFIVADAESTAIALADDQNEEFFSVRFVGQQPRLTVGKPEGARLQAGLTTGDDGSYLSLIDGGGEERASITARATQTQLSLNDNFMQADLGSSDETGKRAGMFLGKDDIVLASLRSDPAEGGTVTVMNPKGEAVAGLLADDEGGEFHVAGPNGGVSQALIGGTSQGGLLALYDSAGNPRVHMEAAKQATFAIEAETGAVTMTTGETAPRLEVGDSTGMALVQLGITKGGVGMVLTGPGGNGPAGTLGAGLQAASSIQGRK
jgi:hypothetical protein